MYIVRLQGNDHFYRSIMFDLPHKQLSFLMRACVDVLPSFANLRRWGKVLSDKCALCAWRETTYHVLSCCHTALDQGRFRFRHDCILKHVVKQIIACKPNLTVLADLDGHRLPHGGTIPPEFMVTEQVPDIVLIDPLNEDMNILELTSCADREENINNARVLKSNKYAALVADLASDRSVTLSTFEVCALGNIRADSRAVLAKLFGKKVAKKAYKKLAKIAISASYFIFNSRRNQEWLSPRLFERPVDT